MFGYWILCIVLPQKPPVLLVKTTFWGETHCHISYKNKQFGTNLRWFVVTGPSSAVLLQDGSRLWGIAFSLRKPSNLCGRTHVAHSKMTDRDRDGNTDRWKDRQMDGRMDGWRERQQSETTRRGKKKKPCPEETCKITRWTFSGVKNYLPPCYRGSKNVLKVP